MTVERLRRAIAFVLLTAVVLFACDVGRPFSQATSRNFLVATLLSTPEIKISPQAIVLPDFIADSGWLGFLQDAGISWDGGIPQLPGWDGAIPFDAGGLLDGGLAGIPGALGFDAGGITLSLDGITIPPQTVGLAVFGTLNGTTPEPANDALIRLRSGYSGEALELRNDGSGAYTVDTMSAPQFVYAPGDTLSVEVTDKGQQFLAKITEVPGQERISRLRPTTGYLDLPANTDYRFIRPDPADHEDRNLGFVSVVPISFDGTQGEPTFTTIPTKPLEMVRLVLTPSEWKKSEVLIPGSAFPEKNKNYIIIYFSAKFGGPESSNLFIASSVIAGRAELGIVRTH